MRVWLAIVLFAAMIMMVSCGGPPNIIETPKPIDGMPDWFIIIPESDDHLYAVATAVSQDMQTSINKAEVEGRAKLATTVEAKLELLVKVFTDEVGLGEDSEFQTKYTQTIKTIVSTIVKGSRTDKQAIVQEGTIYRAYVLMDQLLGDAYLAFYNSIKTNDYLYTNFQASQAFQEHEKEMDKYEQWKKDKKQP